MPNFYVIFFANNYLNNACSSYRLKCLESFSRDTALVLQLWVLGCITAVARRSSVVCLSVCVCVCLSIGHVCEHCKNSWTDRDADWTADLGEPKEPCIRWESRCRKGKGQFLGLSSPPKNNASHCCMVSCKKSMTASQHHCCSGLQCFRLVSLTLRCHPHKNKKSTRCNVAFHQNSLTTSTCSSAVTPG